MSWLRWWRSRSWRSFGRRTFDDGYHLGRAVDSRWTVELPGCGPSDSARRAPLASVPASAGLAPRSLASSSSRWQHRPRAGGTHGASRRAGRHFHRDLQVDARPTRLRSNHVDPHRGLRHHRRHPDGGRRCPQRLDRLVVCAPDRLGCRVRRTARRAPARALVCGAEGRRDRHPSQLRGRLTCAEDRVRHRRRNREGDRLHVTRRRPSHDLPHRRWPVRLSDNVARADRPLRLRVDRALGAVRR